MSTQNYIYMIQPFTQNWRQQARTLLMDSTSQLSY